MYAVVTTGGKQYRVEAGSELIVERLAADPGASITFDRVLLVGDGDSVTVGTPTVEGATVSATVLGEQLGPKLVVFKFKQKATYRRKNGHRQHLTRVRIDEISAGGKSARATKAEKADEAEAAPKADKAQKADAPAAAADVAAAEEKPKRTRKPAAKKAAEPAKAASTDEANAKAAAETEKPKRTRKPAAKKAAESEE